MKAKYLEWLEYGRNLAPNTIKSIESDFDVYGEGLETATRQEIEMFVMEQNKSGMSSATVARRIASLRGFFEWQIYNGYREGLNPAAHKVAPKVINKNHEAITKEELEKLYNNAPDISIKTSIALMGYGGLRLGEVIGIGKDNKLFKDENNNFAVHLIKTKGNKERKVTLSLIPDPEILEELENKGGLFGERGRLTSNGLWRRLEKYFREQDVDISSHNLRATFATLAIKKNVNVSTIRDCLGHSTLEGNAITSRYVTTSSVEQQAEELMGKMG